MIAPTPQLPYCTESGSILSFSLMFGLRLMYPGLSIPIPVVKNVQLMPNCDSYPSLYEIIKMAAASAH